MSHPRGSIQGMHTASGLHLVIHGNAVEAPPAKKRRRWPFVLVALVAVLATLATYLPTRNH